MSRPKTRDKRPLPFYRAQIAYACYVLVDVEGYTQEEAARLLDIGQASVSRHRTRYLSDYAH